MGFQIFNSVSLRLRRGIGLFIKTAGDCLILDSLGLYKINNEMYHIVQELDVAILHTPREGYTIQGILGGQYSVFVFWNIYVTAQRR
jgi:hypothetical protein